VRNHYPALELLIITCKAIGLLMGIGGTITGGLLIAAGIASGTALAGLPLIAGGIGAICGSIFGGISMWAAGELYTLFIDIEANTRRRRPEQLDRPLDWIA
jgi:hypothetical protein